jgi:hypothetical protein
LVVYRLDVRDHRIEHAVLRSRGIGGIGGLVVLAAAEKEHE